MTRFPRSLLSSAALTLAAAAALTGCSTGSTTETETSTGTAASASPVAPDAFPVTIKHAYGETTIDAEPTRVATLGWSDHDDVLALGVVPVGSVAITWGGNEAESTPWFDEKLAELGGEQPVRYSDADGAPIEELAKTQPDLILATNSGITEQEYKKLSKLAPVVAFPGDPWTTSWQDSLAIVGEALGRTDLAGDVQEETEESMAEAARQNPQIVGKTFIFGALSSADTSKIDYYLPADNRPRLLADLGMVNAPIIEKLDKPGQFYATISAERATDLESDVFITYAETKKDLATFQKDPLLSEIPGIANGHVLASIDKTDGLGMSAPSPLAIPYAMTHFVPQLAKAVDGEPTIS